MVIESLIMVSFDGLLMDVGEEYEVADEVQLLGTYCYYRIAIYIAIEHIANMWLMKSNYLDHIATNGLETITSSFS